MNILYELSGFEKEYYVLDNGDVMVVLSKKAWSKLNEKKNFKGEYCVRLLTKEKTFEYFKKSDLMNGIVKSIPTRDVDRRKNEKMVLMLKDGNVINKFNNANEASKQMNVTYAGIYNCCNNNKYHKTAGGYQWKYEE